MAGIGSIISLQRTWLRVFVPVAGTLVLLASLLAGCGGATFDYVGKWEGMRKLEAKPGQDQRILNSLAMVKITVNADGTFDMFEAGLKKSGNVYFGTNQATLRVTRIMDVSVREYLGDEAGKQHIDISLIPQKDGALKYIDPKGFDTEPIILRREAKP